MSREKNVWFAEEILLDAKLINLQIEAGEWDKVEELLKAEAVLSRDSETGRLRPKKASEYTLRLIAEVLRIMKLDIQQHSYNISTLAVAEQCLRLIRSCAASGMKLQTYISKDLSILDDMLTIFNEYQHNEEVMNKELLAKFESCMVVLMQTLGNLVVNNPFNQTIIWEKFGSYIITALLSHHEKIASCAAMIVYNILLGQPNVLPDDVLLLNALAFMYSDGNSEFPHLIIEYLIGVENTYIEKLYNRLEPDTKLLILNLAYNILISVENQDVNVSVNFIKFIAHEFKMKSDCILKTVDKYVASIEPQEVVFLLDIIATASSMDTYMECLQSDASLFINISFLLRSVHDLGKQDNNFFSSIHKLYSSTGRAPPEPLMIVKPEEVNQDGEKTVNEEEAGVKKCDSTDMLQGTESVSECTESENSEQYFECNEQPPCLDKIDVEPLPNIEDQLTFIENKTTSIPAPVIIPDPMCGLNFPRPNLDRKISETRLDENLIKMAFSKNINPDVSTKILEQNPVASAAHPAVENILDNEESSARKVSLDEMEPPLIIDSPDVTNEATVMKDSHSVLSRESSVDILKNERKNSVPIANISNSPKITSNSQTPFNMSRQQSVEPGIEASETVIREMTIELSKDEIQNTAQETTKVVSNQIVTVAGAMEQASVNLNVAEAEMPAVAQPKVPSEPIPVKKSQNVSAEFDLNEQLQKILGISADKANLRAENSEPKEIHSLQSAHPKTELSQQLSQSANIPPVQNVPNPELVSRPWENMRAPNVKIESPDNHVKSRIGAFENTWPKKLNSVVETVEQHVAFGFKATLIRTLGNLCWKNQINKRQIRELGVIPYLLDCCNIDARNPLIMQWVILAVRNLCENCQENQNVISSLTMKEPLDHELLMEMGLTLHTDEDNNSIRIVPLKRK